MNKFPLEHVMTTPSHEFDILVDKETGVNYIVARNGNSVCMIPRLKADGGIYITYQKTSKTL